MRRLYYIADDLKTTENIAKSLSRLNDFAWRYHVISQDQQGLTQHNIRSGQFWHLTDSARQAEQGALIGMIAGVIGAGFYAAFNPQLLPLPISSWLAYILIPAIAGGWAGAFWGARSQHYQLKRFEDELKYGGYVVMIDVPKDQVQMVHQYLVSRVNQLKVAGESSAYAIPFAS
tara:strand:- start:489 stop:1010 length:522 start_codon:yes stop_codon:yes gene_type:complete